MENRVLRAGVPSGIESILEQTLGVPAKPTICREEAIELVRRKISANAIAFQRIEISTEIVRRNALFDMTGARVRFPESKAYDACYVALIDPDISALWGHPAIWAFVPVDGRGEVILQDTQFPENTACPVLFIEVNT